jgi:hypothetical protein
VDLIVHEYRQRKLQLDDFFKIRPPSLQLLSSRERLYYPLHIIRQDIRNPRKIGDRSYELGYYSNFFIFNAVQFIDQNNDRSRYLR